MCCLCASHLLHNGGQPPQSQTTLIATRDHSTAELNYNPLGLAQFTAVGKRASTGSALGSCVRGTEKLTGKNQIIVIYFNVIVCKLIKVTMRSHLALHVFCTELIFKRAVPA